MGAQVMRSVDESRPYANARNEIFALIYKNVVCVKKMIIFAKNNAK